jgi:predicted nucleotidyltransferase
MTPNAHHDLLTAVARAFSDRSIVVIGAVAMQWHFASFRGTMDLDLCIAMDLDEHERASGLPAAWKRMVVPPHRWMTDDGQMLDILPAADHLLQAGLIHWPNGTVMDMSGLDIAMYDNCRFAADLPPNVAVATKRALFLAKVASWLDRPQERQKDLGDLGLLLENYLDDNHPRRFDEPGIEAFEWSDRPAALLGMDLRTIGTARHRQRLQEFLLKVRNRDAREHRWMLHAGPRPWRDDSDTLSGRLDALVTGLGPDMPPQRGT